MNIPHKTALLEFSPKKHANRGKKFPYGTLSLSFIGAKDWSHKEKFFRKFANFDSGVYFTCQEKYGGNSFNRKYSEINFL